jgi:precorrin-2 methylase
MAPIPGRLFGLGVGPGDLELLTLEGTAAVARLLSSPIRRQSMGQLCPVGRHFPKVRTRPARQRALYRARDLTGSAVSPLDCVYTAEISYFSTALIRRSPIGS